MLIDEILVSQIKEKLLSRLGPARINDRDDACGVNSSLWPLEDFLSLLSRGLQEIESKLSIHLRHVGEVIPTESVWIQPAIRVVFVLEKFTVFEILHCCRDVVGQDVICHTFEVVEANNVNA